MNANGYQLIDHGAQQKLERFGQYRLVRPCAQAVWPRRDDAAWRLADSVFTRDSGGTGTWQDARRVPEQWEVSHAGFNWRLHRNEHGNTGIFPEQEACWRWLSAQTAAAVTAAGGAETIEVLNLFGYTGGSTLACAAAGARVCHVDASKTSVKQARDNAEANGHAARPVRWLVEDAARFAEREVRRGNRYAGIILDPPTFGRGPQGEVWQIDEAIVLLLANCARLLADPAAFVLLTSHSPGYTPIVLVNLLAAVTPGPVESGEMVLHDAGGRALPNGSFARWGAVAPAP